MIQGFVALAVGLYIGRWWALLVTAAYVIVEALLTDLTQHAGFFGPLPPTHDLSERIIALISLMLITLVGILIDKGFRLLRQRSRNRF